DLLELPQDRPKVFYRGYDLYDTKRGGFVSETEKFDAEGRSLLNREDPRRYFRFAVYCEGDPTQCDRYALKCTEGEAKIPSVCGNGNGGHVYGTQLDPKQKDALVEYLKTF